MVKLTEEMRAEILRLYHAEHWPVGTISAQKGIHHSCVRRVLGMLPARDRERARPLLQDRIGAP